MTDPDRRRRRLSVALLVVILVATGLGSFFAYRAVDSTSAIRKGDEVAACRAEYRAGVDDAQARASVLFLRGLAAATTDDDATLNELITRVDGVSPIDQAIADVETASDVYRAAVRLSRTEPNQFLADCRALP